MSNATQMADLALQAMANEYAKLAQALTDGEIPTDGYQRRVGELHGMRLAADILRVTCKEYDSQ